MKEYVKIDHGFDKKSASKKIGNKIILKPKQECQPVYNKTSMLTPIIFEKIKFT